MDYQGRTVVVTGGTGGLGTAVVEALIGAGATCHVPYRGEAEGQTFRHRGHKQVMLYPKIDLTDEDAIERFYQQFPNLWASIHVAGGFAAGRIAAAGKSVLTSQLDVNVMTCYLCCRGAVMAIVKNSAGGRIVNVAARPALEWRSGAGMAAYAASKAAVAALTVALAEEVAKDGVLVNAVAPSILDTPANRNAMPKADHAVWPKVEDVAQTILFLASPANKVTRGAVVPVYGRT
ncbi:MAG TPA: SDR family NAD(P)-dependent oxidoreductase [Xanthobacteraceae bacterium]|nr:SDR family NAD(P)-dependent oxidoreductase [Xanthobacteraceae bacterium]